jgi:SAM-dependent methyltransferase
MNESKGSEFYDQEAVFDRYLQKRQKAENPNDLMERPAFLSLTEGMKGQVLDLGCGYGDIASELLARGASHYTGIDPSNKMIALAQEQVQHPAANFFESTMEDWHFQAKSNDWVISRLALHYIEDLEKLFQQVYYSLKSGGKFLFSVEHPLLTSSMHLPRPKGKRQDYLVDQYFDQGARSQAWMGGEVVKYHRTMEGYWQLLKAAGFEIEEIREARPERSNFEREEEYERRRRIPLFLVMRVAKK